MALFTRRETPPFSANYRHYVPYLRKDFLYQCAYCERTEAYMSGEESFEVEHFRPRSIFPDLSSAYHNLYYCCRRCNGNKGNTWPSETDIAERRQFVDPCLEDLYQGHLLVRSDGDVDWLTPSGEYSRLHLGLHREGLKRWRRARANARLKMPLWKALEAELKAGLEKTQEREEKEQRLAAVREYIEEAKQRFLID
jgi:hypothetical protein